jgi:hypothetical protein
MGGSEWKVHNIHLSRSPPACLPAANVNKNINNGFLVNSCVEVAGNAYRINIYKIKTSTRAV